MKTFEFALVDAFANKPFSGNPCAIVLGADSLSGAQMLQIAKEMNQSETAFLMNSKTADLRARYFTPAEEIPLAGHPTIASVHYAFESGLLPMNATSITLELNEGPIEVQKLTTEKGEFLIRMFQRKPIFGEFHDPEKVLPLFNLNAGDLLAGARVQTVSTGTPQLMIPLKGHSSLKNARLRTEAFLEYKKKHDFFSPHLFCLSGATPEGSTFARHFGVSPDTLEDPFTGSATGGMAAYLWKHGLISNNSFVAEQGHWMNRPGKAYVEIQGPSEEINTVSVAGTAVTVVRGQLSI